MTEEELVKPIVAAARERGWWISHDPDSRRQERGEPDLTMLWDGPGDCPGPHRFVQAECKRRGHHRTDAQRRYANAAAEAGVRVFEWRLPDDYDQAERALGLPAGTLTEGEPADDAPTRRDAPDGPTLARVAQLVAEGYGERAAERIAMAEAEQAVARTRRRT